MTATDQLKNGQTITLPDYDGTNRVWTVIRRNKSTISIRHENGLTGRDCLYLNRFLDIKTGKVIK
jgi:hypothetical protein